MKKNAIKLIKKTIEEEKRVAVCGNGGSAVAASHYITDWNKNGVLLYWYQILMAYVSLIILV